MNDDNTVLTTTATPSACGCRSNQAPSCDCTDCPCGPGCDCGEACDCPCGCEA